MKFQLMLSCVLLVLLAESPARGQNPFYMKAERANESARGYLKQLEGLLPSDLSQAPTYDEVFRTRGATQQMRDYVNSLERCEELREALLGYLNSGPASSFKKRCVVAGYALTLLLARGDIHSMRLMSESPFLAAAIAQLLRDPETFDSAMFRAKGDAYYAELAGITRDGPPLARRLALILLIQESLRELPGDLNEGAISAISAFHLDEGSSLSEAKHRLEKIWAIQSRGAEPMNYVESLASEAVQIANQAYDEVFFELLHVKPTSW